MRAAYRHYTERVDGRRSRARSDSFKDFYSQAPLFWNSMSDWEQAHIVEAFSFELGKVRRREIRERVLGGPLHVDPRLPPAVATTLGLDSPAASEENAGHPLTGVQPGRPAGEAATRKIAVLAADGIHASPLIRSSRCRPTRGLRDTRAA